jgi:hypothetical protein
VAPGSQPGPAAIAGGDANAIPAKGWGWNEKYIYVGVTTNQDVQKAAQTIGISSLDSGDQKADAEAMIHEINRQGGLFGRKVKGIYLDVQTANDPNNSAEAACAYMTQDHKIVALVNGALENDTAGFRACMAKAGIPVLALGGQPLDDKEIALARGVYSAVVEPTWNRFAPALVRSLVEQNYFSAWNTTAGAAGGAAPVKVGLLAEDSPQAHRVAALVADALKAAGHPAFETSSPPISSSSCSWRTPSRRSTAPVTASTRRTRRT